MDIFLLTFTSASLPIEDFNLYMSNSHNVISSFTRHSSSPYQETENKRLSLALLKGVFPQRMTIGSYLGVVAGTAALAVQLQRSQAQPLQVAEAGSSGELRKTRKRD